MRRALLAIALLGVAVVATPSRASTYYDYWGYWHKPPGTTAWEYSKVGPSGYYMQPDQPQVEGWRFAVGTASPSDPQPRPANVTYDDYCAGKNADAKYRVLLVVDYGTQSGAPKGPVYSCYGTNTQPSGRDVLDAEHPDVRDNSGLICAIDGYPKTGCGEVVSSPSPTPARTAAPRASATTAPATSAPPPQQAFVASPSASAPTAARHKRGGTSPAPNATASDTTSVSPSPSDPVSIVATQFVPPRRRGGIPYGFVAGCVFLAAVVGAVFWQQRRRAG